MPFSSRCVDNGAPMADPGSVLHLPSVAAQSYFRPFGLYPHSHSLSSPLSWSLDSQHPVTAHQQARFLGECVITCPRLSVFVSLYPVVLKASSHTFLSCSETPCLFQQPSQSVKKVPRVREAFLSHTSFPRCRFCPDFSFPFPFVLSSCMEIFLIVLVV